MRVSVTGVALVAARAVTPGVTLRDTVLSTGRVVVVLVFVARVVAAARWDTDAFVAGIRVAVRAFVRDVVDTRCWVTGVVAPRFLTLPSRTAARIVPLHIMQHIAKIRIFFISD